MGDNTEVEHGIGYDHEMIYKIIVVGDTDIGKTTLIQQFVQYPDNKRLTYSKLIGVCRTKEFDMVLDTKINKQEKFRIKLVVWDLPDSDEFSLTHEMYYHGAQGILLGFDLTRDHTCFNLKQWLTETRRCGLDVPIVLFGNKCDLTEERKIFQDQIDFVKEQLNVRDFVETSALTDDHVSDLFTLLTRRISEKIFF